MTAWAYKAKLASSQQKQSEGKGEGTEGQAKGASAAAPKAGPPPPAKEQKGKLCVGRLLDLKGSAPPPEADNMPKPVEEVAKVFETSGTKSVRLAEVDDGLWKEVENRFQPRDGCPRISQHSRQRKNCQRPSKCSKV
jgi:hypothetical protein